MSGVSPWIAGHLSFWAFDSTFGSEKIHRGGPRHFSECQLVGRALAAYSVLSELGLNDGAMRVHVVAPGAVVFSILALFTPCVESERVVALNAVAVNPGSKPHVVQHDFGVRVRTLGLLCDVDVLEGQSTPIASNLRQVVDIAVSVLAPSPMSLERDNQRGDRDTEEGTETEKEGDNYLNF